MSFTFGNLPIFINFSHIAMGMDIPRYCSDCGIMLRPDDKVLERYLEIAIKNRV